MLQRNKETQMAVSAANTCNLLLYYQDQRIANQRFHQRQITLSKQSADRTNDIVCAFFRVTELWDKKLFAAAFSSDMQFDWLEFGKIDAPAVLYGIITSGNKAVIYSNSLKTVEVLDKGSRKVHVTTKHILGDSECDLTRDDLCADKKNELPIALYNSDSFCKHNHCVFDYGFTRFLEVSKD